MKDVIRKEDKGYLVTPSTFTAEKMSYRKTTKKYLSQAESLEWFGLNLEGITEKG